MKNRLIASILLLLLAASVLSSCSIVTDMLGDAGVIAGEYEGIYKPTVSLSFLPGGSVTVSVGTRSMQGSYKLETFDDGTASVYFDFGDQTLPRCSIHTGKYPVSFGEQKGIEYMLIFGKRYNKVG